MLEKEFINGYHVYSFDADLEMDIPYAAGKFSELIPKDRYKNSKMEHYDSPLFNESNLTKRVIPVGKNGLYFLQLISGYWLDSMIVEPDDVVVDIYFSEDKKLIYSFYNPTDVPNIVLTASKEEDTENIYTKLKLEPTDIIWRNYFIERARHKANIEPPPIIYADIMTADQVAEYLKVEVKTIRNWSSNGKIPVTKIGNTARYRKSDIDDYLKKNTKKTPK